MTTICLTGLDGGNPLAFLAALGALGTLNDLDGRYRLSWKLHDGWRPVIQDPTETTPEALAARLADALRTASTAVFEVPSGNAGSPVADSLTMQGAEYRRFAISQNERRGQDFAAAFACDGLTGECNVVLDTAFRTMSGAGHQHFLKSMRDLVRLTAADHVNEALFGPWRYADDPPIMRWDPEEDRRYALRWREPSGDPIRTVRGANRLAVEGLCFFPAVPVSQRLETTGFVGRRASDTYFTWPIWTAALSVPVVRSLLASADLRELSVSAQSQARSRLMSRGVAAVMRSQRITVGKYRNFGPAMAL